MKGEGTSEHQAACLWGLAGRPIIWLCDHHYLYKKKALEVETGPTSWASHWQNAQGQKSSCAHKSTHAFHCLPELRPQDIQIEVPCLREKFQKVRCPEAGCWGPEHNEGKACVLFQGDWKWMRVFERQTKWRHVDLPWASNYAGLCVGIPDRLEVNELSYQRDDSSQEGTEWWSTCKIGGGCCNYVYGLSWNNIFKDASKSIFSRSVSLSSVDPYGLFSNLRRSSLQVRLTTPTLYTTQWVFTEFVLVLLRKNWQMCCPK